MAIFAVFLMIAFALPSATSQLIGDRDPVAATIHNGKVKITQREFNMYQDHWRLAKSSLGAEQTIIVPLLLGGGFNQARIQFGAAVRQYIDQNEEIFMLLVKEARELGITASDDSVQTWLSRAGISKDQDPVRFDQAYQAVKDLLSVAAAADRAAAVYKISQPDREYLRATRYQSMSLNLIEFNAGDFIKDVAQPTEDEIKKHYEKYKKLDRDQSPSGFGYHLPNRIRFDSVMIREEDIRKAIAPVDIDEQMAYFVKNKTSEEFVTTTQPAANSPDAFNIGKGPMTRPMTFKEAQDKIIKKLTDQRIAELTTRVRDRIRNIMKPDAEACKAALDARKPVPNSSLGVPFNSFKYLQALRDTIQKEFKSTITVDGKPRDATVDVVIENNEHWNTPTMLFESEIGKCVPPAGQPILAVVLTQFAEPFLTEDQKSKIRPDMRLGVWEPTAPFGNFEGTRTVIARITDADPAHDAPLKDVQDQVVSDVKRLKAMALAKQAAVQALDKARAGRWLQTVAGELNKKPIKTGLFDSSIGDENLPVPGYEVKDRARKAFATGAFALLNQDPKDMRSGTAVPLSTAPSTQPSSSKPASTQPVDLKNHPIGVIELPTEGKVLAAEVEELKPRWIRPNEVAMDMRVASEERSQFEFRLRQQWFLAPNIKARMGYQSDRRKDRDEPAPSAEFNPFLGNELPE